MVRPQTANQQAARSMLRQGAGLGDCSGVGYRGCYPALCPFLVGVEGWWPGFGQVLYCSSLLLGVAGGSCREPTNWVQATGGQEVAIRSLARRCLGGQGGQEAKDTRGHDAWCMHKEEGMIHETPCGQLWPCHALGEEGQGFDPPPLVGGPFVSHAPSCRRLPQHTSVTLTTCERR